MTNNYDYLFVGEERSQKAIDMGWTWRDKRLAASHLSKALENLSLDWERCDFTNIFEEGGLEKVKLDNPEQAFILITVI